MTTIRETKIETVPLEYLNGRAEKLAEIDANRQRQISRDITDWNTPDTKPEGVVAVIDCAIEDYPELFLDRPDCAERWTAMTGKTVDEDYVEFSKTLREDASLEYDDLVDDGHPRDYRTYRRAIEKTLRENYDSREFPDPRILYEAQPHVQEMRIRQEGIAEIARSRMSNTLGGGWNPADDDD
jgi:hypothetical protein